MKKRFQVILLAVFLTLSLFSCGKAPEREKRPPSSPLGEDGVVTVLLDAGHGFRDVGCTSEYLDGLFEYQLTMDFVTRLSVKLRSRGYNVILTHDGERYITEEDLCKRADELGIEYLADRIKAENDVFDAYERAVYANVLDAESEIDLMLSIHVNANANSDTVTGFEIDYCAENSSSEMTKFAFNAICDSLERDFEGRRLKAFEDSWDMSFIVTKYTMMPSILFETGFASTPSDAELLLDGEWRDSLMTSVADGIEKYFSYE
ncbi:MAG: N-acetylmuramoyl-L-alanine amidase [Ruminococcaceae bacterium]|nr:N-acetylmuramoyl-L-alanine amidase [Oscillospiraceae bacterium]